MRAGAYLWGSAYERIKTRPLRDGLFFSARAWMAFMLFYRGSGRAILAAGLLTRGADAFARANFAIRCVVFDHFRAVAQGLARLVRDQDVGGSNPLSPTSKLL